METILPIIMEIIGGILWGSPIVIAFLRNHPFKWYVIALNILLGWTTLGWIAAFVWSWLDKNSRIGVFVWSRLDKNR